MANREGSEFIVKLNGVRLPPDVESHIEKEIRATVIRELARIDFKGDLGTALGKLKGWRGLWLTKIAKLQVPTLTATKIG